MGTSAPMGSSGLRVVGLSLTVFLSCCLNVYFLEVLLKAQPSCTNLVTFTGFLFVSAYGFVFTSDFCRKPRRIPLRSYILLVIIFFASSVANNSSLSFHVPMPLHMVFRSGSLLTNLILGAAVLRRRYSISKYMSVALITIGIIICTFATSRDQAEGPEEAVDWTIFRDWCIGIALLSFALLASSYLGIYQEQLHSAYGKHPSESMFYSHFLPMPFFLLFARDLQKQVLLFNQSDPVTIPFLGAGLPWLWWVLIANTLAQYVCTRTVFLMSSECSSLTVTLVVTLRKFISLIFSVLYFNNPFTAAHWAGTALIFTGTLIFVDIPSMLAKEKQKAA